MLELYHNDMSTCAQKVRTHLAEKGLSFESHELNLRAGDQHRPEFLKLNPKGVVPVLVHDGYVVTESNIIMEYVEDAFADSKRLMPAGPRAHAETRKWLQRLDSGLHLNIAVLSIGIAFRDQLMAVHNTPEKLDAFYKATPDPALRAIYQDVVPNGTSAKTFLVALAAWKKLIADMNEALQSSNWLVGDAEGLADIAFVPYLCRMEHMMLHDIWAPYPRVAAWFARMKETHGYREGIERWLNPKYLELMKERGESARKTIGDTLTA